MSRSRRPSFVIKGPSPLPGQLSHTKRHFTDIQIIVHVQFSHNKMFHLEHYVNFAGAWLGLTLAIYSLRGNLG